MWKFKFGLWAVVLITSVFSFSACGDDDDNDTFVPPANIEAALKQLYPGAQNIEWEVKGIYYVADCWVTGNELDNVNQLVPAVYTAFMDSNYSTWVVTDVYVLTYPLNPTTSVIQVKQGSQRYSLYFSQEGGLLHEKNISNGDDTNWPPTE